MVFFSCNVCGEALKKNQVDKHCMTKCRSCEMVSCIDCGKDFWGNDYENHTKCISEDQKYSGKGFVPKVNKGEAKQDRWIEQVQIAIDKNKNNQRLRGPLESIKNYPNIPRKKNKFENFLQNSLRIWDRNLISKLWEVIMEEAAKNMKPPLECTSAVTNGKDDSTEHTEKENGVGETVGAEKEEKKLSKRERKEERRKKMNKKEKKDQDSGETVEEKTEEESKPSKKKKKRKHAEEEIETKGKKRRRDDEGMEEEVKEDDDEELEEEPPLKKKTKFSWENVITEVLKSKGEISVKKLKKKVLSEYVCQMGEPRSEEKLWTKFDKKLSKNPNFKVFKERVKLVEQT